MKRVICFSIVLMQLMLAYGVPTKPNLVMVLIDDMGAMDCSEPFIWDETDTPVIHPDVTFRTPNVEIMADNGMKFSTTYAMTICTPTRVCLLTGKNSIGHGMTYLSGDTQTSQDRTTLLDPPPDWPFEGVLDDHVLITELLSNAGYRNLMVGKTHWGGPPTTESRRRSSRSKPGS